MSKRVIFFTKYTRKGASSRLRTFQYLKGMAEAGFECSVSPFFTDSYLDNLYTTRRHSKWSAFLSFVKRLWSLLLTFRYDVIVIEKELFPYFPAWPERILSAFGKSYIVDYDDAIFHNYDQSSNPLIRRVLSKKISTVMYLASKVVAGNEYLRSYAAEAGVKSIVVIPTVIDVARYPVKSSFSEGTLVIGWIGSPITAKYLQFLKPVFAKIAEKKDIKVKLVGAGKGIGLGAIEECVPWDEQSEASTIMSFDIGIMPLEDNIWERGKCGYKLIQYMGCGLPVIGTPIGVNNEIIKNGVNGFAASTAGEWEKAILFFLDHPEQLSTMGKNGRDIVEQRFSLQYFTKEWAKIIEDC